MHHFLIVLLSWFLAILAWTPIGLFTLKKLNTGFPNRPVHTFILGTLVGAAINSSILGILSFWFPITAHISIILAVIGGVLFARTLLEGLVRLYQSISNWSILGWVGMLVFTAITVLCSLHTSLNNDSGLYYIQFMNWINTYPVVLGLANLHDRFGFNSHWHLLNAAFNLKTVGLSATNDLNGLLFMLIGIGCFDSASRTASKESSYDGIWALFPIPMFLLLRFLTSTAPDLPSTLIPLVYFSYLVAKKDKSSLPVLVVLIAFASTIKVLSALHIIILLPVLYWTIKAKEFKSIGVAVLLGAFIVAPWLGRNVQQTGYLVFPMEGIDLIDTDWKVPSELATNARKMIDTHARSGSYDISKYGAPTSEWIGFWLSVQSKSVLALLGFVGLSSLLILIGAIINLLAKRRTEIAVIQLALATTVLASFGFWWQSGPNPRFIYGVVFFFFAYAITFAMTKIKFSLALKIAPVLALVPLLAITKTVLKEPGPKIPTEYSSFEIDNQAIFYPTKTDKCWEQELPCTTGKRTDLKLRGADLGDGFSNP
jgi:hypothetical protein